MSEHGVAKFYAMESAAEAEAAYDTWARDYEPDLCKAGYRIPAAIAAIFTRFVPLDASPILDAGCGSGLQTEGLALAGYRGFTGIDFSEGMLDVARDKGIYAELRRMVLGETLDLPDDHFAAVISAGCITPGHAPPNSYDELVRVCKPGGPVIFSLREDAGQDPAYPAAVKRLEDAGTWTPEFVSDSFHSMPYGEGDADITHRIHVYRVN